MNSMDFILAGVAVLIAVLAALPFLVNGRGRRDKGTVSRRWLDEDMRRRP